MVLIICTLCSLVLLLFWVLLLRKSTMGTRNRAAVVVLGDIGRSPRMQNHAISLAGEDYNVDFIGYGGSIPHIDILSNERIKLHHMKEVPVTFDKLPKLLTYMLKAIWQSLTLFWTLCLVQKPSCILLQNPPAIPTLAVLVVMSWVRGCKLLVDWHNYGYTIMTMALGDRHPLVKVSTMYEKFFGKFASANICVTNAMREDLQVNWKVSASTMYDRPPVKFKETPLSEQHELFSRLSKKYPIFKSRTINPSSCETRFTVKSDNGTVKSQTNKPALLLSSTSWTADEDFSILLNALEKYEKLKGANEVSNLPELICVITGKGPQKEHYLKIIAEKSWQHVEICTPWLEAEDYPLLLGSADVGVCLHMSSSGLDLPMKVVDMFGCGLPVCAIHFQCLNELVLHGENGLVFHTEIELAEQLQELLSEFPEGKKLKAFRQNLKKFQETRWDQAWRQAVLPLLRSP